MSIDNVRRLMRRVETDDELRTRLVRAAGQADREAVLAVEGLPFSEAEFDEAMGVLHVRCRTEEEARRFHEFRMWWELLRSS